MVRTPLLILENDSNICSFKCDKNQIKLIDDFQQRCL